MLTDHRRDPATCTQCRVVIERCSFCEKEVCRDTICFRCLRIRLGQSMAHPHVHGG